MHICERLDILLRLLVEGLAVCALVSHGGICGSTGKVGPLENFSMFSYSACCHDMVLVAFAMQRCMSYTKSWYGKWRHNAAPTEIALRNASVWPGTQNMHDMLASFSLDMRCNIFIRAESWKIRQDTARVRGAQVMRWVQLCKCDHDDEKKMRNGWKHVPNALYMSTSCAYSVLHMECCCLSQWVVFDNVQNMQGSFPHFEVETEAWVHFTADLPKLIKK